MDIRIMDHEQEHRASQAAGIGLEDSFRHLSAEKLGARMLALCIGTPSPEKGCVDSSRIIFSRQGVA